MFRLVRLNLAYVGILGETVGPLLWPAVVAHALLVMLLLRTRTGEKKSRGDGREG